MSERALPNWIFHPALLFCSGIALVVLIERGHGAFLAWRERSKPLPSPQCYELGRISAFNTLHEPYYKPSKDYYFNNIKYEENNHLYFLRSILVGANSCSIRNCSTKDLFSHEIDIANYLTYRARTTFEMSQARGQAGLEAARIRFDTNEDRQIISDFRSRVHAGVISRQYIQNVTYARMLAMRSAAEFRPCNSDEVP
jgi:hypothetical protein